MNPVDVLRLAANGVGERRLRFALNLLGVLIGCAAITGLVTVTQGLKEDVRGQLNLFGPTNIIVMPGEMRPGAQAFSGYFTWRDVEQVERVEHVEGATPIISGRFVEFTVKGRYFRVEVFGVEKEYKELNPTAQLAEGRNFASGDVSVAVVGANVAHPLDAEEPVIRLGDRIRVKAVVGGVEKTVSLRVIGILKRMGSSLGANLDDSIAIPLKTAQQLFEVGAEFNYILAQADSLETVEVAAQGIEERLGDRATAITSSSAMEQVNLVLSTIQSVLGGIAAISLVVAGVGIINTMTVSVIERTREIGTLKAVGARSLDVLSLFLAEAALTGLAGGFLGAGLGFALAKTIGRFIGLPTAVSPLLWGEVVAFAAATSLASGLYPSLRASRMNPVEALRHE